MATRKSAPRSRHTPGRNPPGRSAADAAGDAAGAIGDSAQKIWLAGLGAFERARAEGPKMFDTLVDQGKSLGGQARVAADQALRNLKEGAASASGRFDKLEQVFEDRVSRSLKRLGVVTRGEVADLNQGVRDLADQVRRMMSEQGSTRARSTARGSKRTASTAKRKAKRAAGNAERTVKRAAGNAKRKVKRAASTAKRSVAQRTRKSRKA